MPPQCRNKELAQQPGPSLPLTRIATHPQLVASYDTQEDTLGLFYIPGPTGGVMQEIDNLLNGKETIIIIGDFNCIQENKDAKVHTIQKVNLLKKYDQLIKPIKTKYDLTDTWREHNKNEIEYTHISQTNATRIDQALCNKINANVYKIKHTSQGNFDHKGIQIKIGNRAIWGKGTWKLNSELIENHENKIKIRETIKHLKEEKYRMEPLKWWDYFKMKIKKATYNHRNRKQDNSRKQPCQTTKRTKRQRRRQKLQTRRTTRAQKENKQHS